jgi:hypothetical protein
MNKNELNQYEENQIIDRDILDMIYGRNGEHPMDISDKWREIVEILMETD